MARRRGERLLSGEWVGGGVVGWFAADVFDFCCSFFFASANQVRCSIHYSFIHSFTHSSTIRV